MELRQLQCFIAVAEELHFRRAAERIGLASTALSAQVRSLEEELGVALFFRTTRHVSLTQAGAVFLDEARAVIERLELGVQAAQEAAASGLQRLRVGGIDAALIWFLPPVLEAFRKRHPTVHLPLREVSASTEQVRELLRHRVDVAFFRPPIAIDAVVWETLFEEPVLVALPRDHALAERAKITVQDIADETLISYPRHARPLLHAMVVESFARAGSRPKVGLEVLEKSTLLKLVGQGMGVGLTPAWVALESHPDVVFRRFAGAHAALKFGMAWRENDTSETLHEFLDVVRAHSREAMREIEALQSRLTLA